MDVSTGFHCLMKDINAFKIHKMLPQTCLRNPLIPPAGVQTVESGAKWRAERKGNTRNSTSDNPIFQISSGEYPRFIFLLRFYLRRPRIYLNAWNKLLIGHTLWTFSWRDAWEIKAGSGHAEIYFCLRVAGDFISILGSCLQYVFWLMWTLISYVWVKVV